MSSEELGVGIIGLGIGKRHLETVEASDVAHVAAICDLDSEKLKEVGRLVPKSLQTTNDSELIHDSSVDVVVVASYDASHGAQVLQALKAKKRVFVEKPLCTTEDEFEAITLELRGGPQNRLSTNMPLRARRNFIELKNRLSSGFFGDPYLIEADYMYGRIHKLTDGWRGQDSDYSVTLGGGIHMIDLIMWLTNSRVSEVSAFGNSIATEKKLPFGNPDTEIVNLRLVSGVLARVSSNFPVVSRHHHRVAVFGTERAYLLDATGEAYSERVRGEVRTERLLRYEDSEFLRDSLASFLSSIAGGTKALVSTEEAMVAAQVALKIKRSVAQGTVELIPSVEP